MRCTCINNFIYHVMYFFFPLSNFKKEEKKKLQMDRRKKLCRTKTRGFSNKQKEFLDYYYFFLIVLLGDKVE